MRFLTIQSAYEKEITGVSSSYHIEFKRNSFEYAEDKILFDNFFRKNNKFFDRNVLNTFAIFPQDELIGSITLFPSKKRLKEIDFLRVCPFYMGIWVAVSQKVMNIFSKYNLPELNKIKVKVDGFFSDYYLIGFPILPIESIDYEKSRFLNKSKNIVIKYGSVERYSSEDNQFNIQPKEIHLLEKYEYDILNVAIIYEISLIPEIVEELKKEQCIGFHEVEQDHLIVISPDN